MGKGLLIGVVEALRIPYTQVHPRIWQKVAWEGVSRKGDTKHTSLVAIRRLYPHMKFIATPRSKKPHDGIVDAVLIAYYLRMKYEGGEQRA